MSFSLNDLLSAESLKDSKRTERTVSMISADKLHPSGDNFYSMDDERIQKMAASILMLSTPEKIGIQQNLVVSPITGTDEYTILTGETRWRAVMQLIENGDLDTDKIPCEIQTEKDPVRDELILILTNSTQRIRSDAEKMHEVKRLRELLEEYKRNHKLGGTIQRAIGDILGISKTKVGTLENIDRNLSPELLEEYEKGTINTSVANKLAGLDADAQQAGKEMLDAKGAITAEDVQTLTDQRDGWVDNPYIPDKGTDRLESVPYEMNFAMNEETENDTEKSEESLHFGLDMASIKGSNNELIKDASSDHCQPHPELIEHLRKILILESHADAESFANEISNKVLGKYKCISGKPVFTAPNVKSLTINGDDSVIFLETFVHDFYKEIANFILNAVINEDVSVEDEYGGDSDQEDTTA